MDGIDNYSDIAIENDIERRFVVDCNEVIELKLVRNVNDVESEYNAFKPEMSHQIFGKTEKIFGYNDLKIKLYYTAGWLRTYIGLSYKEIIHPSVIGLPADNVIGTLSKFLAHDYFENIDLFVKCIEEEPSFKPSGILIDNITINDRKNTEKIYEVYHLHLSNTSESFFNNYYQRLQRLLIWYIDGASYVDVEDDRWNYFIVYEKYLNENNEHAYSVVAFSTVYEHYAYPDHIRPRISQLLVLPPFQKCGLAVYLLNSIYKFYCKNKLVIDITVEDPTDNCQVIRDFVDLYRCEKLNYFTKDVLESGFSKGLEDELRNKLKIHKKQARRLYEILLLRMIDKSDEAQYKKYRLQIKNRLNVPYQKLSSMVRRMNYTCNSNEIEQVSSLAKPEIRYENLQNLYNDLEKQYERVLKRYENSKNKLNVNLDKL